MRALSRSAAALEQVNEAVGALVNNGAAAGAPVSLPMAVFAELTLGTGKALTQSLHDTSRVLGEKIGKAAAVLGTILRNEIERACSTTSYSRIEHDFDGYLRFLLGTTFGDPSPTSVLPHKLREMLQALLPNVGSRTGGPTAAEMSNVRPPSRTLVRVRIRESMLSAHHVQPAARRW